MKEKESLKLEIHACIEAIAENPRESELYQKLGDLQLQCGDAVGASKSYRSATELRQYASGVTDAKVAFTSSINNTDAYLELLKNCLTYQLWNASDGSAFEVSISKPLISFARIIHRIKEVFKFSTADKREFGLDWPAKALTMAGRERLNNIEYCTKLILQEGIEGDFIETGVWRGGCTIFMRALLKSYGDTKRSVWVADSFSGMPKPNKKEYPADKKYDLSMWKTLAVTADEVRENFKRFDLLDEKVKFLEGWFSETLPKAPIEKLAMIRLDGDLYESTMDALKSLYHKLSDGGFIIVDDYHCAPPCKQAIDEFREANSITDKIVSIDWSAIYWRKNTDK
ncbi:TylF/MycF/NovP-related O-methyltransferase [uncultured Kordia sp.]|uniref:TylF/MycF/NovP-related O-methyltransferase n=1 Tax=uncultured Kordia sp. TaxID=507699 RepID=UPI002603D369|nr:TylF/MycF/NovP-related O-methyltransferase [uncultured Kordia sp.]